MLKSKFNLQQQQQVEVEEEAHEESIAATVVAEETTPVFDERKLNKSEVSVRLSMLGKTAEGDGYTYLKATCTNLDLTEISAIKCFKHLQFLDLSYNHLTIDALQAITDLPFLILIHADFNRLSSAALRRMKYLQVIIMNNNNITSVDDVYQPELSTLELGNNKISKVTFKNRMQTLKCLDFRNNIIQDVQNFDFPNLDSLYLSGNKITSLVGIEKLVNLRILHARNNPIRLLNGFEPNLKKLQYINLRNCKVSTLKQIKKLRCLPALDTIVLKGCPYMGGAGVEDPEAADEEEDPELRIEVLASLQRLKRLNKTEYTSEERQEAKDLLQQWLEEGENDEEEVMEEVNNEEESNAED